MSTLQKEKTIPSLPLHQHADISNRHRSALVRKVIVLCLVVSLWIVFQDRVLYQERHWSIASSVDEYCPQVEPWDSTKVDLPKAPAPLQLAELLSGAVKVDTSVYDDDPTVADSPDTWEATFAPFRRYLRAAFPLIHSDSRISLELVNQHALLYTWEGRNTSLLPIVLTAHEDVVPVEQDTLDQWTHAPFSGYVDQKQKIVFGRGASDDKASLITLMASVESLLKADFEPKRSIILSFGFDEETRGVEGGEALARRLEEIYGRHDEGKGAMMIIDEGESVDTSYGIPVALPAVAEKGYLDARLTVQAKGGHSSEPPAHTSIGILSRLIAAIEDHPPQPSMMIREDGHGLDDSAGLETLLCLYDSPKIKDSKLGHAIGKFIRERKRLAKRQTCACVLHRLIRPFRPSLRGLKRARNNLIRSAQGAGFKGTFATTQAVDLISGGTKVNALPELAQSVVNLRINAEFKVQDERDRLIHLLRPVANDLNCRLNSWGNASRLSKDEICSITLSDAFDSALEPAPTTPTLGEQAGPFRLLSSVIKTTWKSESDATPIRVIPALMEGNTDTKSYHNLSRHIFRFSPGTLEKMKGPKDGGIHTVDERVQIDSLTKAFTFYTSMMIAVQQ